MRTHAHAHAHTDTDTYIYIQGHFFVDINCAESATDCLASGYNDAGSRDPAGSESCVDLPNFASSSRPAGTNARVAALLGGTGSSTSERSNHADRPKIKHIVLPNGIIVVDCFSVFIACFFGVSLIVTSLPGLMSVGCANVPQIRLGEVVFFVGFFFVCVCGSVCVCVCVCVCVRAICGGWGGIYTFIFSRGGGRGIGVVNGCSDQLLLDCY